MFGINRWRRAAKTLLISGLLVCCVNLWGCGGSPRSAASNRPTSQPSAKAAPVKLAGKISEVSPPEVIQELRTVLEKYQPQVTIASPSPNQVLQDDALSVRLQVKDFPLFKDQKLALGPHLHLFLDNQPYQAVYDVSQPIVLKDLAPGTHTLRAFASRPWHESFKNEGAYAQTTFHVFTKTPNNNPSPDQPLLTYSRPQGGYGAEPIMLDFFLTNAPLHLVAQEDDKDDVADWRIKVTVNGSEFVLDRWQPLYLKGFTPGKNWVQLDYIDEKGNSIQNVYNNTARSFTYTPNGNDTLSKLVRDELSFAQARSIVDPDYKAEIPGSSPVPVVKPSPEVEPPIVEPTPQAENPIEQSEPPKSEKPKPVEAPKGGFFNRFRRPEPLKPPSVITPEPPPSAPPEIMEPIEQPAPKVPETTVPEVPVPQKTEAPKNRFYDRFRRPSEMKASPEPSSSIAPAPIEAKEVEPNLTEEVPEVTVPKTEPKSGFYDRFRRPAEISKPAPSQAPAPVKEIETLPEPAETPPPKSTNPELKTALERRLGISLGSSGNSIVPSPEAIIKPSESEQSEPSEILEIKPVEPKPEPIQPGRLNQFRPSSPIESPKAPIKLPETLEAPSEESIPIKAVE